MKYIIDEDEIKELLKPFDSYPAWLKSKQPVEEVASGKVEFRVPADETYIYVGDKNIEVYLEDLYGKNIKIYVQQVQDVIVTEDDGEY